jgi:hypothetical protein
MKYHVLCMASMVKTCDPPASGAATFWTMGVSKNLPGAVELGRKELSCKAVGWAGRVCPLPPLGSGVITPRQIFEITDACRWVLVHFGYRIIRIQHLDALGFLHVIWSYFTGQNDTFPTCLNEYGAALFFVSPCFLHNKNQILTKF